MKKLYSLLLLGSLGFAQAQVLFSDDLSTYTVATNLSGQGNWTNNSSTFGGGTCTGFGCTSTAVQIGALNYADYVAAATTNVAAIKPNQDAVGVPLATALAMPSAGTTIYYSFLINVSAVAGGTSPADVFRALSGGSFNTAIRMQLKSAAGGFTIGGSKNGGTNVYSTTVYPLNTTHLVIIKYTQNSGTTSDDVLQFFVNPLAASEPATATVTVNSGADYAATLNMDRFLLRTNTASVPTMNLGAFKVAKKYSDLFVSGTLATNNSAATKVISIKENPVSDFLKLSVDQTFNTKNSTVSILDASGRVVKSEVFSENINVKSLKAGVYFVQIKGGKNKSSLRFIKK